MLLNCLCVGAGGFVGSILRYLIGIAVPANSAFPVTTLLINVAGSLVLGFLTALALRGALPSDQLSLMLRVGICGGFTTFSTFSVESMSLLQDGAYGMAALYIAASVVLGVAAAIAGSALAGTLRV